MYAVAAIQGPVASRAGNQTVIAQPPSTITSHESTTVATPGTTVSPAPRSAPV